MNEDPTYSHIAYLQLEEDEKVMWDDLDGYMGQFDNIDEDSLLVLTKMAEWSEDIIMFIEDVFCEADGTPVRITNQQRQLLEAFMSSRHSKVAAATGHAIGKSTLFAWIILWGVLLHDEIKILVTAPSAHQLNDVIWAELHKWYYDMPAYLKNYIGITSKVVYNKFKPKTRFAAARTARRDEPGALQGFHSNNMIILGDECSDIPDNIFDVLQGAMTTKKSADKKKSVRAMFCGNPTRTTGFFYEIFELLSDKFICFHMSSEDSPLVDEEFIDLMASYGTDSDKYRMRVLGLFPKSSINTLITRDEARKAIMEAPLYVDDKAPLILGMDCARQGDDKTVIMLRRGRRAWVVFDGRIEDTQLAGDKLAEVYDMYEPDRCYVDVGAAGGGVIDRARAILHDRSAVIEVNFGGKPLDGEHYVNKRAEMWVKMRDWIRENDGHIDIPDPRLGLVLVEELCTPTYTFSAGNKILMEKKEEIKKRIKRSTDYGDALALTFAMPEPRFIDMKNKYKNNNLEAELGKRHFGAGEFREKRTRESEIRRSYN